MSKHIYTLLNLEESPALVPIVQPGRPNFSICRKNCLKAKVSIGMLGLQMPQKLQSKSLKQKKNYSDQKKMHFQTAKIFNNCATPLRDIFEVAVKNNVISENA